MSDAAWLLRERPSRATSIVVAAALVVIWGYVRLVVFHDSAFPLTYVLPLLIGVWTRDRPVLWAMAAIFVVFHTAKMFWILPEGTYTRFDQWSMWAATLMNIGVGAGAVHAIVVLRDRLERSLRLEREQGEELRAQGEELAQQNEELAAQTEELGRQGEELASQNEELQAQSEEIGTLNQALQRREALLQALLETARVSGSEGSALEQIAGAARDLFDTPGAVVICEATREGLHVCAGGAALDGGDRIDDGFIALALEERRTAGLPDASLRPDLRLARLAGAPSPRAVLCAPITLGDELYGAFVIYAGTPHPWTDEEFRLADWLAGQCARVLQTLRVQSALREADRAKSEFLATLSHELRNPLTAIGFALSLLETGRTPDGRLVEVTRRQLRQLVRLVDDLLDATRMSSNKIQLRRSRVDLRQVVRDAVEASRPEVEQAQHELTVRLPAAPLVVDADPDRMGQIVTNLLSNAVRYTPAGGRITVTASATGGEAVLEVADTGVGMRRADRDRLFKMFSQLDGPGSGGLGIGLALVRGIAELHGGQVEAHSDGPGQGSRFTVSLPLAAGSPDAAEPDRPGAEVPGAVSRVLIVDDNADALEMMAAMMELHGHAVRVAHDAESALAAAREFQPHAAVLDIGLPGVDGYELARRLRQDARTRDVRLVALTGWGQDEDRTRARAAGFDVHLTKPADPQMILAAIRNGEPA